jgi:hypothetical protein
MSDAKDDVAANKAAAAAAAPINVAANIAAGKSSGHYRLRVDHVDSEGRVLSAGTEVGTDTPYMWPGPPTNAMEGLDAEGVRRVNEVHMALYGAKAPWDNVNLAEQQKKAEDQRKVDEGSAPVSFSQAAAQDKEWKGPKPVPPPAATKGGDAGGGPGVANASTTVGASR